MMNIRALQVLVDETRDESSMPGDLVLNYIYHVLMHEYIHALGYLDEQTCRDLTLHVTSSVHPPEHPAHVMASRGIGACFPRATRGSGGAVPAPPRATIEMVPGFDRGSTTYFS